jgi:CRISPR-associated protein Csm2
MTPQPNPGPIRPNPPNPPNPSRSASVGGTSSKGQYQVRTQPLGKSQSQITPGEGESLILQAIETCATGLAEYPVRAMVKHAEAFGTALSNDLKTTQVRRFLDAIKRLNTELAKSNEFSAIETEVLLLQPKVAYTAARHKAAKPFSTVITAAIDKVHNREDFVRLVQLIESIIAYHKAAGGRDQ